MSWIVMKLKEGSTWAGIGAFIAGFGFPHAAEIGGTLVPAVGSVVAVALAIWFP